MRMGGETSSWLDGVVVHHPEGTKGHVVGIKVAREGKGEPGLKPTMVGLTSVFGPTYS
jgi:hypothetical protein